MIIIIGHDLQSLIPQLHSPLQLAADIMVISSSFFSTTQTPTAHKQNGFLAFNKIF